MIPAWLLFVAVAMLVAVAGVVVARSADRLGTAFRLERSMTGFMLLAAATSLPELVVSCEVARNGAADMAAGSLMGSCLINLLVLAVIDLSRRSGGRILSLKAAAHALAALTSILLAGIVAVLLLTPGLPTFGRFHLGSFLILAGYLVTARLVFVDGRISRESDRVESAAAAKVHSTTTAPKRRPLLLYLLGTAAIFALASPLASSSEQLAGLLGLSGTFFGAVFLATVTSLPEVATTYEASRMDADDMAIGNILGSNAFNLLILVAVDAAYPQPLFGALDSSHSVAAIGIVVTTAIAAMGMLYRVERRMWFLEPDAIAVIVSSLLFFYLLYIG